jgi:hypothetical protein
LLLLLHLSQQDPFISAALGPNAKLERMRAAALRLGGQGLNATHDDHLLIIGDAAGHIDPLTGEWKQQQGHSAAAAAAAAGALSSSGGSSSGGSQQWKERAAIPGLVPQENSLLEPTAEAAEALSSSNSRVWGFAWLPSEEYVLSLQCSPSWPAFACFPSAPPLAYLLPCRAVPCWVVLCRAVLCCAVLGCAVPCCDVMCTGEGIHTAMMGGRAAAETVLDMRSSGDFSKKSTALYTRRWMKAYGHDFPMSTKFAELIYRWVCGLWACKQARRSPKPFTMD